MLAQLTLALVASNSSVQVPAPVGTPDALAHADVRVVLQANETHFVATNTSFEAAILVFGTEDLGVLTTLRLAPGAQVIYSHAGGEETNLWVEVLSLTPDRVESGAYQVSSIASNGGALWIVQEDHAFEGYCRSRNDGERGVRRARPDGDLMVHVPGGPAPRPKGDTPPVIGDGPLPVV